MKNLIEIGGITICEPSLPVRLPSRQCSFGSLSLEDDRLDVRKSLHANSLMVHILVKVQCQGSSA